MTKPKYEVADIFRQYGHLLGPLSDQKRRIVRHIIDCRTEALGGHIYECENCHHIDQSFNSCCDRHCPKCQHAARKRWVENRMQEVLPVPYYHVVFTLPHIFNEIILTNKKLIYALLLKTASETVKTLFAKQYDNAEPGIISVLHTWGQNLSLHPHVHMVIPSGGLADDDTRWVPCKSGKKSKKNYFLPIKTLSSIFRARFTAAIKKMFYSGKICFLDVNAYLSSPSSFQDLIDKAYKTDWVVYAKSPFATPIAVLKYLGGYTHRIAFSNHRIIAVENGTVRFRFKDYREKKDGGSYETKDMTLSVVEFMRRFLMHVVPRGFARIRYYGFLASARKKKSLASAGELLAATKKARLLKVELAKTLEDFVKDGFVTSDLCPSCKAGKMVITGDIRKVKNKVGGALSNSS